MDGVLWLLASWAIVAAICYFIVGKLGRGEALPASDVGPRSENAILLGANPSAAGRSEWLNETLSWLWSNNAFSPAMTTILIRSLNDSAKKLASDESEILFEEGKTESAPVKMAPTFTEIRAAQGPKGHLSVKANMHIPSVDAKLITSQRQNGRMVVSNLEAVISDVRGEIELRLAQIADEIYLMSCFSGRPSMNVTVVNKESHQPIDLIAAEDHIRKCILSCVVNFNLNECVPHHGPAHSYSEDYPPHQPSVSMVRYLSDAQRNEPRPRQDPRSVPNKLQISIIRAQRLGENDEAVHHPYVCIEMDEPAQKFTTQQSVNNRPYWEETFDFNLNPASDEVLFEIYDAGEDGIILDEPKFLGLAIVGLSELKQAPEPVHHLRLQGRPYKNDNVSGVLTIECRFYHDPSVPVIGKESQTVVLHQPDGSRISDKETLDRRFVYDPHDNMENFSPIPNKTTTVTVKTFKQEPTEPPTVSSVHQSQENFHAPFLSHPSPQSHSQSLTQSPPSSDWNHAENNVSPNPPDTVNFEPDGREHREQWLTPQNSTQQAEPPKPPYSPDEYPYGPPERKEQAYPDYDRLFEENAAPAVAENERQPRDRERRKNYGEKRDRSFFGELADRLRGRSRSKQRAKSLDEHNPVLEEAVSMPPSRDQSRTRDTITRPNQHTGSATSIPDSTAWPKDTTPSTLVLEVGRPDAPKRYYYIPPAVANDPTVISLMRRGKKLHMHNDHTFVAVKPAGRVTCNVCSKRVSGNFMKQAYQCRDCRLVSHKACHTRTRHPCPQSHVNELVIHNDVNWAEFIGKYQVGEFISEDNL